jgi:hypothetical protein
LGLKEPVGIWFKSLSRHIFTPKPKACQGKNLSQIFHFSASFEGNRKIKISSNTVKREAFSYSTLHPLPLLPPKLKSQGD